MTNFSDEEHSANDVPPLTQSPEWAAYHGTGNTLKASQSNPKRVHKAKQQSLPVNLPNARTL